MALKEKPESPPAPPAPSGGRWLWVGALALALLVLGADSARRLDGIYSATNTFVGSHSRPEADAASPTSYRWNEHRLVFTQVDSYQWLLQAEQELSGGGIRIRDVQYDNEPAGREVHWAGFLRWWGLGVAGVYHMAYPTLTAAQSLERVAPWANTALLVVFLLALTPLIAARLGSLSGALFALGCVAVYPFYDFFGVGYFDHHGVAATLCLAVGLFLVAGGVGWVRAGDVPVGKTNSEDRAAWYWLPAAPAARRWFIASGLAGAAGLWISAAAMAPVLAAVGLAVLFAFWGCARADVGRAWRFEPGLFRTWGIAGASGSLALYLLEYFPDHLGMRLEVNHPLYALAFLGGGDLLARVGTWVGGRSESSQTPMPVGWVVGDLALVLLLPLVILVTGSADFRLRDPFLWNLHTRSITEFLPLHVWMQTRTPAQAAGELSLVPLVAFPIAAALWSTDLGGWARGAWRTVLVAVCGAAAGYAFIFFATVTRGNLTVALIGAAAATAFWFLLPLSLRATRLAAPFQAALLVASVPAFLLLLGALLQFRWLGNADALWLGALVIAAAVLTTAKHPLVSTALGRTLSLALLALVLLLAPTVFMQAQFVRPNGDLITRDASLWLRHRTGDAPVVIFAPPTETSEMIWFGGFKGIGTLYWENLAGLRAATEIYDAPDAASARALLARYGVTHLAFFGWDPGLQSQQEFANQVDGTNAHGFLNQIELDLQAGRPVSFPSWLVPLPFVPATVDGYNHPVAQILEVVDDQPPAVALVRLAQFYKAMENRAGVEDALARSLEAGATVPGLAMSAEIQTLNDDRAGFVATLAQLRSELARSPSLDLADHLEAAVVLGLGGDKPNLVGQMSAALAHADESQMRRLPPERLSFLIDVSRQLGLDRQYPDAIALAQRLIPAP